MKDAGNGRQSFEGRAVYPKNPLADELRLQAAPEPCTMVIFGASGDLTRRKLMPSLYSLAKQNLLPVGFSIVGSARTRMDDEAFRSRMREAVVQFSEGDLDLDVWEECASSLFYVPTDPRREESVGALTKLLERLDEERRSAGNRLFYFATPPEMYVPLAGMLSSAGLNRPPGWTRVIVEKPFGHDLESMRRLNSRMLEVFREDQIYRIDHYLGKETVQNIMVMRFANGIFEPLWNRRYVDHVQITAAENLGVGDRGEYYEGAGALRDMIQNHLFQVFSLVAMEPPVSLEPDAVHDEKRKVLRAVRPIQRDEVAEFAVRGQYDSGAVNGQAVKGYQEEQEVRPDSNTETFAAVKLLVDNWRWAGVPFYLRSAKRMPKQATEVTVQFKDVPHLLFRDTQPLQPNSLSLRLQPDDGIILRFGAKVPGRVLQIRSVNMDFRYGTSFGKKSPRAYERLLLDAMLGDSTLFNRGDSVELSWLLLGPVLEAWKDPAPFPNYEAGSWGPKESEDFMARDGRRWRRP